MPVQPAGGACATARARWIAASCHTHQPRQVRTNKPMTQARREQQRRGRERGRERKSGETPIQLYGKFESPAEHASRRRTWRASARSRSSSASCLASYDLCTAADMYSLAWRLAMVRISSLQRTVSSCQLLNRDCQSPGGDRRTHLPGAWMLATSRRISSCI